MMKKVNDLHCLCCLEAYSSYFAALSPEDLKQIQAKKEVKLLKKGTKIFLEGSKPHGIFCLRSGHVKIFKNGSDGREHITRLSFAGEFIGLKALLTGTIYSVSAQAMDDVVICFIPKNDFFELTIKYPEFTQALIFSLSRQLVDAEHKMISLAHKPVKERLSDTLLFLYQQFSVGHNGFEVPYLNLTRLDLANIIGTAQETVIRLLAEWKEEGILAIKGRKIFILDETRLKQIANSIS
ncbi:MAG: Crp/Fnr family transcriptional regulator [Bacteroidales bacterium]|nr:Crp/Fnr family transcriptional regulator [Bacteroidales bacterium]